jgi:AraC-like DNA-binding protein
MPAQFRVDLTVTPGNAREFDLWRSGVSPLFAMNARDAKARASFGVSVTSFHFAGVALACGRSSAATFERTAPIIARSALDNICLLVYGEGGCAVEAEGRSAEVLPGDVLFIDLSRPIKIEAPDYESLTLIVPRASLEPLVPDVDRLHGRILKKSSPLNAMLVGHLRRLFAEAPALGLADGRAATTGTTALVAAFAKAAVSGPEALGPSEPSTSLNAIRRFIEMNLHDPALGPDFICRRVGVSRAKLYRTFEPKGGVSRYIHLRRLRRAHQLIADPACASMRVGAVATRCGFSGVSVFSRAFAQAYGLPPTELRDAFARVESANFVYPAAGGFGAMSRWLLGPDAILK